MDNSSDKAEPAEQHSGSWFRRHRMAPRRSRDAQEGSGAEAVASADRARAGERQTMAQDRAIWTDSHCHLQDDRDLAATLRAARAMRVGRVVCVGTDETSSRRAVELATKLSRDRDQDPPGDPEDPDLAAGLSGVEVWATIGLHPHDAKVGLDSVVEFLDEMSKNAGLGTSRVVAIGECGLDYHYEYSGRETQRDVFAVQVALANRHDLALVIHTREAWEETFSVLEREGVPKRTIFHCFSGGEAEAKRCLSIGAYLSFSGIVTFANAGELRDVAAHCPLDRLLVETDSPFLTPVPHRGRPNSPGNVSIVGEAIAKLKTFDPNVVAAVTWMNAESALRLGV